MRSSAAVAARGMMKRILKLLKNDWERVLFWLFSILFALVLLAWGLGFGREKETSSVSRSVPLQTSLLNQETAFAFQDDLPANAGQVIDPFALNIALPQARPPRRPLQTGAASSDGGSPPRPAVAPAPKPKPPPETPPPPPPVEKKMNCEYLGCMTTASGQKVALIKDTDSGKTGFLTAGEKFGGLEIKEFTDQAVTVKNARGTEVKIEFGKRIPVVIE